MMQSLSTRYNLRKLASASSLVLTSRDIKVLHDLLLALVQPWVLFLLNF